MKKQSPDDLQQYKAYYSETKFWEKLAVVAKKIGLKAVYALLLLYYALVSDSTPVKYKAMIMGALGYFVVPLDFLPDVVPMVGYTDDMAALAGVLVAVAKSLNPAIKQQAKDKLTAWFGKYDESQLNDVIK